MLNELKGNLVVFEKAFESLLTDLLICENTFRCKVKIDSLGAL